ncbi:gpW family protein [Vibrio metschnikovii]|nr:gpW family protein [Vibrio metschnikovii]EKO3874566.1 gpW family protein [Vibrio metschnikovii]
MTLKDKLNQAEHAYHSLQTGSMAVSVQKGDKRVEFNRANIHELRAYIDELRAQLGITSTRRNRPAGVLF